MLIIPTIKLIKRAITIIDLVLAPAIIIISGPKATLGKLFNIVRQGSNILFKILNSYKIIAIIKLIVMPRINAIKVS